MDLFSKYTRHTSRRDMESDRLRRAEQELLHLNTKIVKLLDTLEEGDTEQVASTQEEECVICVHAAATMQTWPCGHRVVCRRCFVKTIQAAVSQRLLPLRCVVCRSKILRLRQGRPSSAAAAPSRLVSSRSWQGSSSAAGGSSCRRLPASASSYSMMAPSSSARSVPSSTSLYSVASAESSLSGASSVSSGSEATRSSIDSRNRRAPLSSDLAAAVMLRRALPAPAPSTTTTITTHKKLTNPPLPSPAVARLPPIREFQREFRAGRRETNSSGLHNTDHHPAASVLRPPSIATPPSIRNSCGAGTVVTAATERARAERSRREEKAAAERRRREEKAAAERRRREEKAASERRKREEKARQRAEKEARRVAQEQERQARQLAKQRAKQAAKQAVKQQAAHISA